MSNKLSDRPVTRENLEAFMKTQDDFALELFAYSLARDNGFAATHAGSYTDRITGKTRQFDVRAILECAEGFHINLAIECKALRPSFPLLVSQIPRLRSESFQHVVVSVGERWIGERKHNWISPSTILLDDSRSLYPAEKYVGKALVQVGMTEGGGFISNDYEVFDKWGQAIASASGLIQQAARRQNNFLGVAHLTVVLPVLVVPDQTLWAAKYSEFGVLKHGPTQEDEVEFYLGNEQVFTENGNKLNVNVSHMHVVTKTGLVDFLQRFSKSGSDSIRLLHTLPLRDSNSR